MIGKYIPLEQIPPVGTRVRALAQDLSIGLEIGQLVEIVAIFESTQWPGKAYVRIRLASGLETYLYGNEVERVLDDDSVQVEE